MARSAEHFLASFVVPLVRGGAIHVGKPLTETQVVAIAQNLGHASVPLVDADEARTETIAELVVRPPSFVLDEDEVFLAAALHNLLFLEHPRVDSWLTLDSRVERVRDVAARFASRPRATDRYRILARHGLLHNLFDLSRKDIKLSWWTGSARYFGQQPPTRLKRWASVRRVSEETSSVGFESLLGDPDVEPVVAQLLSLSPLTDLLTQPRDAPPLSWETAVVVLRDRELARAVAYRALSGPPPDALLAPAARYAAAFERFLEKRPPAADIRAVAAFLVHLNALLAVAESRDRDLDAPSPLLTTVLAPERAARRPRGLGTFFALPDVLAEIEPALAVPPGMAEEDAYRRRWEQHRRQTRDAVSDAVRDSLLSRMKKVLGTASAAA